MNMTRLLIRLSILAAITVAASFALAQYHTGSHARLDCTRVSGKGTNAARAALQSAMIQGDEAAISAAVVRYRQAAPPCLDETLIPFPSDLKSEVPLNRLEILAASHRLVRQLSDRAGWDMMGKSKGRNLPPRHAAAHIKALISAWAIDDDPEALILAKAAGEHLLQVQTRIGMGGFGFPVPRRSDRGSEYEAARHYIETAGSGAVMDGWIVKDGLDGGLNYDTGLAGEALFDLFHATGEVRYHDAALRAATWSLTRPVVVNFNYNGFIAALSARAFRETGERAYLDNALRLVDQGVLPGLIKDGPRRGRWIDPHNDQLVYRAIMIGQLARVLAAFPADYSARDRIETATYSALQALVGQLDAADGYANPDALLSLYCDIEQHGSDDMKALLKRSTSFENLSRLFAQTQREVRPSLMAATGCFLKPPR
ncbi:MAG: hypothetical protein AAF311_06100 [Pseudomonadota bacterium]